MIAAVVCTIVLGFSCVSEDAYPDTAIPVPAPADIEPEADE